jgi:hypothetical protein
LNSFASIDYLFSLKSKLDIIFNEFNKRKDGVLMQVDNKKWEPFQGYELFKDFTSIEILDLAAQIITNTVLIVTKTKGYYDQYDHSNKQNTGYLISLLVSLYNID